MLWSLRSRAGVLADHGVCGDGSQKAVGLLRFRPSVLDLVLLKVLGSMELVRPRRLPLRICALPSTCSSSTATTSSKAAPRPDIFVGWWWAAVATSRVSSTRETAGAASA